MFDAHLSPEDKLQKVRTKMVIQHPFFGVLLLHCRTLWTEAVPTAATDGKDIYINKEFIEDLSIPQLMGLLTHEIMHKMLLHALRRAEREGKRWNLACDYVINDALLSDGFILPDGGCVSDKYTRHMTADHVYNALPPDTDFPGWGGAENDDHLLPGNMTPSEQNQLAAQIREQVAEATIIAKQAGKMPGNIERLVTKLLEPKIDWKEQLRHFFNTVSEDEPTFVRPDRRMLVHDLYMPSLTGQKLGTVGIVFDTSGSIYHHKEAVDAFCAEIKNIVNDIGVTETHVFCVDTRLVSHETYDEHDELEFNLKGGGGTAFNEAFQGILDMELPIEALLVFTDMEIWDIEQLPEIAPTLWVSYGKTNIEQPFGEKINLPSEDDI